MILTNPYPKQDVSTSIMTDASPCAAGAVLY